MPENRFEILETPGSPESSRPYSTIPYPIVFGFDRTLTRHDLIQPPPTIPMSKLDRGIATALS